MFNPPAGDDLCGSSSKETRRRCGVATLIGKSCPVPTRGSCETEEEFDYIRVFDDF